MKYLIEVFTNDPGEPPYEEWAQDELAMYRVISRIAPMLREGDTMYVTDTSTDEIVQERRKVAA